jgi:uncharacterized protein YjdB
VPFIVFGVLLSVSCGTGTEPLFDFGPGATAGCSGCFDVVAVRVDPVQATIVVGETVELTAEAVDVAGAVVTGRSISWKSSDEEIAKVTSVGIVSGLAVGSVTISVTVSEVTGTAVVDVTPAPAPAGE